MLVLHGDEAGRWESQTLRCRLFTMPATLARTGRRVRLHLAARSPFARLALAGSARLEALAPG